MPDQTPKAFLGCVPHAPFMMLQDPQLNQPFWDAYETQAKALRAFVYCATFAVILLSGATGAKQFIYFQF